MWTSVLCVRNKEVEPVCPVSADVCLPQPLLVGAYAPSPNPNNPNPNPSPSPNPSPAAPAPRLRVQAEDGDERPFKEGVGETCGQRKLRKFRGFAEYLHKAHKVGLRALLLGAPHSDAAGGHRGALGFSFFAYSSP